MALPLPTSADVRKLRDQTEQVVGYQIGFIRTPLLAGLGAGDLALHALRELPERVRFTALRRRADDLGDQARWWYAELTERGEDMLGRLRG